MSIQVKASQGPLGHVLAVYFFPSLRVDYDDAYAGRRSDGPAILVTKTTHTGPLRLLHHV